MGDPSPSSNDLARSFIFFLKDGLCHAGESDSGSLYRFTDSLALVGPFVRFAEYVGIVIGGRQHAAEKQPHAFPFLGSVRALEDGVFGRVVRIALE